MRSCRDIGGRMAATCPTGSTAIAFGWRLVDTRMLGDIPTVSTAVCQVGVLTNLVPCQCLNPAMLSHPCEGAVFELTPHLICIPYLSRESYTCRQRSNLRRVASDLRKAQAFSGCCPFIHDPLAHFPAWQVREMNSRVNRQHSLTYLSL